MSTQVLEQQTANVTELNAEAVKDARPAAAGFLLQFGHGSATAAGPPLEPRRDRSQGGPSWQDLWKEPWHS